MIERPILTVADEHEWWSWLKTNHDRAAGVRLAVIKKGSARPGIAHRDALGSALCFGWIDGQLSTLDDDFFLVAFQPRRPKSIWSRINRDHAMRLVDEGRMQPPGLREIERAKADGRWEKAYESAAMSEVPDDLAAALAASPDAREFFAKLSSQNRFAILFRIHNVARAETRARKIAEYVSMLERGETIHPQRAKP